MPNYRGFTGSIPESCVCMDIEFSEFSCNEWEKSGGFYNDLINRLVKCFGSEIPLKGVVFCIATSIGTQEDFVASFLMYWISVCYPLEMSAHMISECPLKTSMGCSHIAML